MYNGFLGLMLGISASILVYNLAPTIHNLGKEAIVECQKSLPRDQHCKLIAVPVEKK